MREKCIVDVLQVFRSKDIVMENFAQEIGVLLEDLRDQ